MAAYRNQYSRRRSTLSTTQKVLNCLLPLSTCILALTMVYNVYSLNSAMNDYEQRSQRANLLRVVQVMNLPQAEQDRQTDCLVYNDTVKAAISCINAPFKVVFIPLPREVEDLRRADLIQTTRDRSDLSFTQKEQVVSCILNKRLTDDISHCG